MDERPFGAIREQQVLVHMRIKPASRRREEEGRGEEAATPTSIKKQARKKIGRPHAH